MYEDGKQIASNVPASGPKVWDLTVPVKEGSRYILAQQADLGDPYGGYRGQPGLRCHSPLPIHSTVERPQFLSDIKWTEEGQGTLGNYYTRNEALLASSPPLSKCLSSAEL